MIKDEHILFNRILDINKKLKNFDAICLEDDEGDKIEIEGIDYDLVTLNNNNVTEEKIATIDLEKNNINEDIEEKTDLEKNENEIVNIEEQNDVDKNETVKKGKKPKRKTEADKIDEKLIVFKEGKVYKKVYKNKILTSYDGDENSIPTRFSKMEVN